MKKNRKWELLLALIIVVVFVCAAWLLRDTRDYDMAARKRTFAIAKVLDVETDNSSPDTWTEGRRIGEQMLKMEIISGEYKGEILEGMNYMNAYYNVDAKVGTRLIVRLDFDDNDELYIVSIPNYDRSALLIGMLVLFAAALIIIGGNQGARALVGLVFTLLSLWYILIPGILKGIPPILITILIVALASAGSLVLLTGFSKKTLCALLACVGGVIIAGILAWVFTSIASINGFNMGEAEELVLRASESNLKISGLLISGILISSLGAVMDTAMAIVSALNEVYTQNPTIPKAKLFKSGMTIGKDAMGTMANTLILAFVGSSLNMFILLQVYDYPLIQIINNDTMVIEVIQGIAGSLGIVMTVPFASWLATMIIPSKKKK